MQGISVSIAGISITFLSLGVLIVFMYALRAIFKPSQTKAEPVEALPQEDDQAEIFRQRAAGIAVGVAFLKGKNRGGESLGKVQ